MNRNRIKPSRGGAIWLPLAAGLMVTPGCDVFFPGVFAPPKGNSGLTGKFVGSERCSQCHQNIHDAWAETLHAKAFEALENIGESANEDCIGCHSTGWDEEGGFKDRATTDLLAGVGCEACHGGAADHVNNVSDASLRPKVTIEATVCGKCHTGEHQPNFDDWMTSKHAASIESPHLTNWATGGAGSNLTTCGLCHSGDYFYHKVIKGEDVNGDLLKGKTSDQMNRITCAICHNPHARTGHAAQPDEGRDYQLRYPQIKFTSPTTDLNVAQDPTRFNLCGQCHHVRNNVWTDTSREPHPSDQANVFFGEMPLPASKPDAIVPSRPSVHLNAPEQCSTCHVARKTAEGGIAPQISGHNFEINFLGCVDCHHSVEIAKAKLDGLKAELAFRAALVRAALDAWATRSGFCATAPHTANCTASPGPCWEFPSECGPTNNASGQGKIPDDIKKARYIYYYVTSGGGNGAHNPDFVRDALMRAEQYANGAPAVP